MENFNVEQLEQRLELDCHWDSAIDLHCQAQ